MDNITKSTLIVCTVLVVLVIAFSKYLRWKNRTIYLCTEDIIKGDLYYQFRLAIILCDNFWNAFFQVNKV